MVYALFSSGRSQRHLFTIRGSKAASNPLATNLCSGSPLEFCGIVILRTGNNLNSEHTSFHSCFSTRFPDFGPIQDKVRNMRDSGKNSLPCSTSLEHVIPLSFSEIETEHDRKACLDITD